MRSQPAYNRLLFWLTYLIIWVSFDAPRNSDLTILSTIALYFFVPIILIEVLLRKIQGNSFYEKWKFFVIPVFAIILCAFKICFEKAWWWFFATVFDHSFTVITYEGGDWRAYSSLFKSYLIFLLLNEVFLQWKKSASPSDERTPSDMLFIKTDKQLVRIAFSDIVFIEGLKDYVKIHTANEFFITKNTLQNLERTLSDRNFLRVQKSYIVNIDHIQKIDGNRFIIADAKIPIGNTYRQVVEEKLGIRL